MRFCFGLIAVTIVLFSGSNSSFGQYTNNRGTYTNNRLIEPDPRSAPLPAPSSPPAATYNPKDPNIDRNSPTTPMYTPPGKLQRIPSSALPRGVSQ